MLHHQMLISWILNIRRNMFIYFYCGWFFSIIFISNYIFNQRFKISLSDFWYWSNCYTLVPLEGKTATQKSLFSQAFSFDSSFFFVLKEWRQFNQQKSQLCFDVFSIDNEDHFFYCKIVQYLSVWNHLKNNSIFKV